MGEAEVQGNALRDGRDEVCGTGVNSQAVSNRVRYCKSAAGAAAGHQEVAGSCGVVVWYTGAVVRYCRAAALDRLMLRLMERICCLLKAICAMAT